MRVDERRLSKTGYVYQGSDCSSGVTKETEVTRRTAQVLRSKRVCWAHVPRLYDVSFACGSG